MPYIVLTEEQARVLREAQGPVDVRDEQGRPLASMRLLTPLDQELLEMHKRSRASSAPPIPSARVHAFLRKLQEVEQAEGIDEAKVQELLRRVRAGEDL
jgi:hypothetical protein